MIDNQNQSSQVVSLGELLGEDQNLIQTDNQLNEEEPDLRNHEYTELIKNYNKHIARTLCFKQVTRWVSFVIFIIGFIAIVCFSISIIHRVSLTDIADNKNIVALITATVSLVSAIVVLPSKIVDFVYNKEEDAYIVEVIKHTQEFDKH